MAYPQQAWRLKELFRNLKGKGVRGHETGQRTGAASTRTDLKDPFL